MKRLFPIIFLLILFSALSTGTVFACGGGYGGPVIDLLTDESEIIVVGRFVEMDDVNMNGVFQAESYLSGNTGAEYITLAMHSTSLIESRLEQKRSSGCVTLTRFERTGRYILFLENRVDGAYNGISSPENAIYFEEADSIVDVFFHHVTEGTENHRELTLTESIAYILERNDQEAQIPLENTIYPRITPILLTTIGGLDRWSQPVFNYYLLPVDASAPVQFSFEELESLRRNRHECQEAPCIAYSPNRLDSVNLFSEQTTPEEMQQVPRATSQLIGERLIFSPTNESLVLWRNGELQLRMLWNPQYGYNNPPYGHEPPQINSISIDNASLNYPAIWSSDGRTLAFSDEQGLWLWDLFSIGMSPQLLIPRVGQIVPTARYFSPRGRYLAIEEGELRYNLDLISGTRLPDGDISPNDRALINFDTRSANSIEAKLILLTPYQIVRSQIQSPEYLQWIDGNRLVDVQCGHGYYQVDAPYMDLDWCSVRYFSTNLYDYGSLYFVDGENISNMTIDFHPATNSLLTRNNEHTIAIDGEQIDLSPYLDEPIINAEWLPSLFYYETDWEN